MADAQDLHASLALCQAVRDRLKRRVDLLESRSTEKELEGLIERQHAAITELHAAAAEQQRLHQRALNESAVHRVRLAAEIEQRVTIALDERDDARSRIVALNQELSKGSALERMVKAPSRVEDFIT